MEAQHYVLKITLKEMALRKTAIILWNRFCYDSINSLAPQMLESLVKKVQNKALMLFIPGSIRDELIQVIKPIVAEVRRWRNYHRSLTTPTVARNALHQLCWTPEGTVDYSKTAEILIRLERVDTYSSYKISCIYCFENDIRRVWGKLHGNCKIIYYNERAIFQDRRRMKLVTFWTHYLREDTDFLTSQYDDEPHHTLFQTAFESAALSGNKVATKYFFQKLSVVEREASLVKTAQRVVEKRLSYHEILPQDFPAENLCSAVTYLLSQMTKEEQREVFKKYPFRTLICFLDWPWQDIFMKVARHTWPFVSLQEYRCLLEILSDSRNMSAFNYDKIFGNFFLLFPSQYRNGLFVDPHCLTSTQPLNMKWFENLFWTNNSECIKLVLRNVNSAEKEMLITSNFGVDICRKLVNRKKWFFLKLFIEECRLTKEAKTRLKDCFMARFYCSPNLEWVGSKWLFDPTRGVWRKILQLIEN